MGCGVGDPPNANKFFKDGLQPLLAQAIEGVAVKGDFIC